jgi:hypothetical protein
VRFIGLDVHRDFCEIAVSEGSKARSAGRVKTSPEALVALGQSLDPGDKVILESTGHAFEIARTLGPFVREVVIANPMHVRARTRPKNEISAVLVRNLKGRPPMTDVFGTRGRAWLARPGAASRRDRHRRRVPAPDRLFDQRDHPRRSPTRPRQPRDQAAHDDPWRRGHHRCDIDRRDR